MVYTKEQLHSRVEELTKQLPNAKTRIEYWTMRLEIKQCNKLVELLEGEEKLLTTLKENIVDDCLNAEDTSVGLYRVTDLESWANADSHNYEGVELIDATRDRLVFKCEDAYFEIYENIQKQGNEVMDSYWDIRYIDIGDILFNIIAKKVIEFRFFKISPSMDLWKHIKEIRELQQEGVVDELCPPPTYWEFKVNDFSKLPKHIKEAIVKERTYGM